MRETLTGTPSPLRALHGPLQFSARREQGLGSRRAAGTEASRRPSARAVTWIPCSSRAQSRPSAIGLGDLPSRPPPPPRGEGCGDRCRSPTPHVRGQARTPQDTQPQVSRAPRASRHLSPCGGLGGRTRAGPATDRANSVSDPTSLSLGKVREVLSLLGFLVGKRRTFSLFAEGFRSSGPPTVLQPGLGGPRGEERGQIER